MDTTQFSQYLLFILLVLHFLNKSKDEKLDFEMENFTERSTKLNLHYKERLTQIKFSAIVSQFA